MDIKSVSNYLLNICESHHMYTVANTVGQIGSGKNLGKMAI